MLLRTVCKLFNICQSGLGLSQELLPVVVLLINLSKLFLDLVKLVERGTIRWPLRNTRLFVLVFQHVLHLLFLLRLVVNLRSEVGVVSQIQLEVGLIVLDLLDLRIHRLRVLHYEFLNRLFGHADCCGFVLVLDVLQSFAVLASPVNVKLFIGYAQNRSVALGNSLDCIHAHFSVVEGFGSLADLFAGLFSLLLLFELDFLGLFFNELLESLIFVFIDDLLLVQLVGFLFVALLGCLDKLLDVYDVVQVFFLLWQSLSCLVGRCVLEQALLLLLLVSEIGGRGWINRGDIGFGKILLGCNLSGYLGYVCTQSQVGWRNCLSSLGLSLNHDLLFLGLLLVLVQDLTHQVGKFVIGWSRGFSFCRLFLVTDSELQGMQVTLLDLERLDVLLFRR